MVSGFIGGCYERGDRWLPEATEPPPATCSVGSQRCGEALERCQTTKSGPGWVVEQDCAEQGLVCAPSLLACSECRPGERRCEGQTVVVCDSEGARFEEVESCPDDQRTACREGICLDLCGQAREVRSNVGCEYWAVDLDNAMVSVRWDPLESTCRHASLSIL